MINYMLQDGAKFKTPAEIKKTFAECDMTLDGISAHCRTFRVHTTAWTESPTVRPFLPPDVAKKSAAEIEKWSETYILRLLDLAAAVGVKIVPMFWGVAYGWEVATGYPWGFWQGADYDLVKSGGRNEFVTEDVPRIRAACQKTGHLSGVPEIHPGTAAMCADDFNHTGKNLRRRQMPRRQCRPVALLRWSSWETRLYQGGCPHLRLPCH